MAIRRDGNTEYESNEPTFEEKKERLEAEVREQLAQDPTTLSFVGRYFSTDEVSILAGCPDVNTVTRLDLRDNQIGQPALKVLFEAEVFSSLMDLDLSINFVTADAVVEVCESPAVRVRNLRALSLEDNRLKDPAGAAIARSENFSRLEWLNLSWNEIGLETARALGTSTTLRNLRCLNLERNYIDEEGVRAMFAGDGLAGLEALNLGSNRLEDEGAIALAQSALPPNLKTLWLTNNSIDEEGARALGESPNLASLEALYIGRNYFKEEGARILYEHPHMPRLKTLVLREGLGEEAGFVNYSRPELLRSQINIDEEED